MGKSRRDECSACRGKETDFKQSPSYGVNEYHQTSKIMNQPSFKPTAYNSVSPYLIVTDAAATIRFLSVVFDAFEIRRFADPASGRLRHAEVRLDDTVIMLGDCVEGVWPAVPAHIHVYVQDVDAIYAKAVKYSGVTSVQAPVQKGDEDKRGGFKDAWGTTWWVATKQG